MCNPSCTLKNTPPSLTPPPPRPLPPPPPGLHIALWTVVECVQLLTYVFCL